MSVFFGFLGAWFSELSPQGNPSVCHGRQLPLHRGAMGSLCPPGFDPLVFGLIGRRRFGGRGERSSPLSPHRNVFSKHSGVPVGLFSEKAFQLFLQNARPSAAVRPPVGGGSFAPPCTPLSCPRKCGDRQAAIPPLREKLSFGARHGFPFRSAYPQEAWSFLRTPPRPAAKRAASTRAATPLPPPASFFFLTARSSFRTSRRP